MMFSIKIYILFLFVNHAIIVEILLSMVSFLIYHEIFLENKRIYLIVKIYLAYTIGPIFFL